MALILAPSADRSKVAQWTVPVDYWYFNIAVRTNMVHPDLWNAFLSPFHWSVSVVHRVCFCPLKWFLGNLNRVQLLVSEIIHNTYLTEIV